MQPRNRFLITEIARAVNLTKERVRQLAEAGQVEHNKVGSTYLFPWSAVDQINQRKRKRYTKRTHGETATNE